MLIINDNDGMTALHVASQRNHVMVVEYLLNQGAHRDMSDKKNCAPLHGADELGWLEIVQCLMTYGAASAPRTTRARRHSMSLISHL